VGASSMTRRTNDNEDAVRARCISSPFCAKTVIKPFG